MRIVTALACAVGLWGRVAASTITVDELPNPAAQSSLAPAITVGTDSRVLLSWVEPTVPAKASADHHHGAKSTGDTVNTLKFASLAANEKAWSPAQPIVSDRTVTMSSADFPLLGIDGAGTIYALWTDGHGGARWTKSTDTGATWSNPSAWTATDHEVEKFALQRTIDGRILVAWLDGRGHKTGGKMQQLYARYVDQPERADQLIDPAVCDCCQTSLAAFLDGGVLVAYRGRTEDEIRDIRTARFADTSWQPPRPLNNDGWHITACPINGPRVATDGSRVAAAWYTAADSEPRVLVSYSPDAGNRWVMPLRIDRGRPVGHVDVTLLHDGAILVTWLESDGSLWLRRITPEFAATELVQLAGPGVASVRGVPRMVLRRDYAGQRTTAELLVAFTREAAPAGVRTLLVTVPEGELVEVEKNCNCAPTAEQLQGFAVRGTVTHVDAATNIVSVDHVEVPGVFKRGTDLFHVTPTVLTTVQPQHEFLGRIARRADGTWWLFDLRILGDAPVAH